MTETSATRPPGLRTANAWRSIRWRTFVDRLLVLILILAGWQIGSALAGTYWLSSPWATISRFVVQIMSGPLKGVTGTVVRTIRSQRIIVSVNLLKRAIAVTLDNSTEVALLSAPHRPV